MNIYRPSEDLFRRFLSAIPKRDIAATNYYEEKGILNMDRCTRNTAMRCHNMIQLNREGWVKNIVFDIDESIAFLFRDSCNIPMPNLIMVHRSNNHAHLVYMLDEGFPVGANATGKQRRYYNIVYKGLVKRLGADPAYSMFLGKSPFYNTMNFKARKRKDGYLEACIWKVMTLRERPYTMQELRSYVDDDIAQEIYDDLSFREMPAWKKAQFEAEHGKKRLPRESLGRNCTLFDELRCYAYKTIHKFFGRPDSFYLMLLEKANELNTKGLPQHEVRGLAKKIARWTSEHLTKEESDRRREAWNRRMLRGKEIMLDRRMAAFEMAFNERSMNIREASRAANVSVRTAYRYLKALGIRREKDRKHKRLIGLAEALGGKALRVYQAGEDPRDFVALSIALREPAANYAAERPGSIASGEVRISDLLPETATAGYPAADTPEIGFVTTRFDFGYDESQDCLTTPEGIPIYSEIPF